MCGSTRLTCGRARRVCLAGPLETDESKNRRRLFGARATAGMATANSLAAAPHTPSPCVRTPCRWRVHSAPHPPGAGAPPPSLCSPLPPRVAHIIYILYPIRLLSPRPARPPPPTSISRSSERPAAPRDLLAIVPLMSFFDGSRRVHRKCPALSLLARASDRTSHSR
jgi:hypothetical protein